MLPNIQYDMIYLAACGVNQQQPTEVFLNEIRQKQANPETITMESRQDVSYMEQLFALSRAHFLDALIGSTLKQAQIPLSKQWQEGIFKAVRKTILFDAEREKLFAFMEQEGIWYLPLKGVILKDYYPAAGMRQMSDNDILFDASCWAKIEQYMLSQGYKAVSVGRDNHDVYEKEPVYNFEMHRSLYGANHEKIWEAYYKDVKQRLVLNSGSSYGYHFSEEDFYVYILSHAYKHYAGNGTGLRSLLDLYVYLCAKEQILDFSYIQRECALLSIAEFEKASRSLCKKVFAKNQTYDRVAFQNKLSLEEETMLLYYLSCGVYGSIECGVEHKIQKFKEKSVFKAKLKYIVCRLFPDKRVMEQSYPFFFKYKFLQPFGYVCRLFRAAFDKERRKGVQKELRAVKKAK